MCDPITASITPQLRRRLSRDLTNGVRCGRTGTPRSALPCRAGHGTQHVALLVHARSSHGELDAPSLHDCRTGDSEDGERVVAPVLAGDDEFQVVSATGVYLPPASGSISQVGSLGP